MLVNKLNWISTSNGDPVILEKLDRQMEAFYANLSQRSEYQEMIDKVHTCSLDTNTKLERDTSLLIAGMKPEQVIEVGCGSGKIYERLVNSQFKGSYTGLEMAEYVIDSNRQKFPRAEWITGSVYELVGMNRLYDMCVAFFVLEHLIYPEKALVTMMSVLKPGGSLVLAFPDFCCSGIVPSQKIGLTYGRGAKQKLKEGKVIDALISLTEGSMMRRTLKTLNQKYGSFVVNTTPYCLNDNCAYLDPDIDAVYLSNKREIESWAKKLGHTVLYPLGTEGMLEKNVLMQIKK